MTVSIIAGGSRKFLRHINDKHQMVTIKRKNPGFSNSSDDGVLEEPVIFNVSCRGGKLLQMSVISRIVDGLA